VIEQNFAFKYAAYWLGLLLHPWSSRSFYFCTLGCSFHLDTLDLEVFLSDWRLVECIVPLCNICFQSRALTIQENGFVASHLSAAPERGQPYRLLRENHITKLSKFS